MEVILCYIKKFLEAFVYFYSQVNQLFENK